MLKKVACVNDGSTGAVPEWTCLKLRLQVCGSNCGIRRTVVEPPAGFSSVPVYSPGGEFVGTTPMQFTGFPSGMIFTPPFTAFGSANIRVTSCCITRQVSGDA